MPWLTPDGDLQTVTCKNVTLPSVLFRHLYGAINALADERNWEQFGENTPEDCAKVFFDLLEALPALQECEGALNVGDIILHVNNNVPTGYLLCNGQLFQKATYPELYAILPPQLKVNANTGKTPALQSTTLHQDTGYTVKFIIKHD